MGGMSVLKELIILMLLIAMFHWTGLWPAIIRGIRELRGERVDPPVPQASSEALDICYKMLGVPPSASWEQIEQAYRQKAKIHHPDHGGDDDAMRALNEAYAQIRKVRLRG
jgi:hypothetical protein